jgi:DNA uptake protein ComE-like DNA-binding protein
MPLGRIKEATAEELARVPGIGKGDAERIVEYFKKSKKGGGVSQKTPKRAKGSKNL